jgi:amidase
MSTDERVHAYGDDALAHHDGVALAALIRRGELSQREVLDAAIARARRVEGRISAIAFDAFDSPVAQTPTDPDAPFVGVPTFVKDNVDVAGLNTQHGSRSIRPSVARKHSEVTQQLLAQGLVVLGKSKLPEFGFSPTTEYETWEPTRNPWNLAYSSGASSGGAAALVAAGVVPIAHGNDGAGSIRIPASCCGLVGLKVTRGRLIDGEQASKLPVKIVSEGVITRSVRDSAHFLAGAERFRKHRRLPPVGLVEGPGKARLRVALVLDSIGDNRSDDESRNAIERVARVLEQQGHRIEPLIPPVPQFFVEDFKLYWGLMAFSIARFGRRLYRDFDAAHLDGLTRGLHRYFLGRFPMLPVALARMQATQLAYALTFKRYDVVLSPVLSHTPPKLGFLSPTVPFDELFARILKYTAFTPLNNAAGSPAIAVPAGLSRAGLPIGSHLSAAHGAERTLLELAYALEAELKAPRIDEPSRTDSVRPT